jgi:hypothetical protein
VAVRIWDPRWLTVWLCAFGIPDGSQCGCDSYRVYSVTCIYYTVVIKLGSSM